MLRFYCPMLFNGHKIIEKNGEKYYQVSFKADNFYYNFLTGQDIFKKFDNMNSGEECQLELQLRRMKDYKYRLDFVNLL